MTKADLEQVERGLVQYWHGANSAFACSKYSDREVLQQDPSWPYCPVCMRYRAKEEWGYDPEK